MEVTVYLWLDILEVLSLTFEVEQCHSQAALCYYTVKVVCIKLCEYVHVQLAASA